MQYLGYSGLSNFFRLDFSSLTFSVFLVVNPLNTYKCNSLNFSRSYVFPAVWRLIRGGKKSGDHFIFLACNTIDGIFSNGYCWFLVP